MNFIDRYRMYRRDGFTRSGAFKASLPTRVQAVYSLARGGSVVYRAKVDNGTLVVHRPHSLVAETEISQTVPARLNPFRLISHEDVDDFYGGIAPSNARMV